MGLPLWGRSRAQLKPITHPQWPSGQGMLPAAKYVSMAGAHIEGSVDVSVIIPALEATPHVLNVVRLLAAQEQAFTFEILLVLNHAPREIAEELPARARLLFCETPGSFAARNAGIAEARGLMLAFTDSDVTPHSGWLREGYEASFSTGFRMLVAGIICMYHEKKTAAAVYDGGLYLNQEIAARNGTAATANLWVPRAAFDVAGLFRENLHAAGDGEFCIRARGHGFHIIFSENAIVYHPTRWRLRDLLRKERRLAGGLRDLCAVTDIRPRSEIQILVDHVRRILASLSFTKSLPVILVAVVICAARWYERVLVRLGKTPGRL